jgi:DNA topoisomerase I
MSPQNPKRVEQNEYRVYDPESIKRLVEVPVKQKPSREELEKVEVVGKSVSQKKGKKKGNATKKPITLNPKGYTLIITEKPQAAAKIAAALSEGKDNKITRTGVSYYELEKNNKKIVVGCSVGHLFTVSQIKKSSSYPIFDIDWFPNFEVKKNDFTKKYYVVLERLIRGASEIIVATDFDIEGEVIGYIIVQRIAHQSDAKRMKFSSLTAPEIIQAYENAHPSLEWGQAIAGETRHFLDWLYGINLSRALMSAIKTTGTFKIMSIGRVQGPALNLIVQKEKQIQAFKPSLYWQVFITVNDGKNVLTLKHNKDISKKEDLERFNKLKGKIANMTTRKSKHIDLTQLQTEAYKFHSFTPSQTLKIAQKLYLSGLISYPRTSSQKIPESMEPLTILRKLENNFTETKHVSRKKPVEGRKSDPAHPAIIPTGNFETLQDQEKKLFDLIVKRFISCYCNDAELANKKVEATINKLIFSEKGLEVLQHGWMNVYPAKMTENEIPDMEGDATIEKVKTEEKETKPPKRFSQASLLSELEKRNLGTKTTRAHILETLFTRNYVQDKSIKATELGIRLIDTLQKYSPIIIDEQLTREIEKDMEIIRSSKKDLEKKGKKVRTKAEKAIKTISIDLKKHEPAIGKELVKANEALWDQQKEAHKLDISCPACTKGELTIKYTPRFKSYFIACTNYPDCKQTYSLPSRSLIKKAEKKCEACEWPMVISIRQGKRPWILCFNKNCPSKIPLDIDGNDKKPSR